MTIDFKRLNLELPALEVLRLLRLECYAVTGGYWRGRCPFHPPSPRRSRSFQVSRERRLYYCHNCKRVGDLIDLAAHVWQVTMWTAAKRLADQFCPCAGTRRGVVY